MSNEHKHFGASAQLDAADPADDHDGDAAVLPDGVPPGSILAVHFFGVGHRHQADLTDLREVA